MSIDLLGVFVLVVWVATREQIIIIPVTVISPGNRTSIDPFRGLGVCSPGVITPGNA